MQEFYKKIRTPDWQYRRALQHILRKGILAKETLQGNGALTCFGSAPDMVFDLRNGIPMITERKIGYKMPIGEILGFIHGVRDINVLAEVWGCPFWDDYKGRGVEFGMAPNDMGPGSYGAAFAAYPNPKGGTINQYAQLVENLQKYPHIRTHRVISWIPGYASPGPNRKVIVAPCHGDTYWRVLNGTLHLTMVQRSADMPIGVPHNMVQYAALLLMMCQVTGYKPGLYVHKLVDAHIFEDQIPSMREMLKRHPRRFPTLRIDENVTDLFDFRPKHFTLENYNPHPAMKGIPYFP